MAKKSYVEELAAWVQAGGNRRPRQDKALVAFLAVRADVAAAIKHGYALKTIWEHLRETGRITYRYETFLRHVKKHLERQATRGKAADQAKAKPKERPTAPAGLRPEESPDQAKQTPAPMAGFSFDATPKKEDLF